MPQNSDVVFILSQYLQCFEKLRLDNIQETYGVWYWNIDDKGAPKKTSKPQNLKQGKEMKFRDQKISNEKAKAHDITMPLLQSMYGEFKE